MSLAFLGFAMIVVFIALIMPQPMFVYLWSWGLMLILLGAGMFFGKKYRKKAV